VGAVPPARTWLEELVVEWLTLEGYLVLTNVRLGGAREADVVGFKALEEGGYEVIHVEAGMYFLSPDKLLDTVIRKIQGREDDVRRVLKYYIGEEVKEARYRKVFVTVWFKAYESVKDALREQHGIETMTVEEVVERILENLSRWEAHLKKERLRGRGTRVVPPESLRLTSLISYLSSRGMLKLKRSKGA